jgi:hypothetical protein
LQDVCDLILGHVPCMWVWRGGEWRGR